VSKRLSISLLKEQLEASTYDGTRELAEALKGYSKKIIVIDDDPTGVQTVHDIPVYTSWEQEDINRGFNDNGMFFILTNSRGLSSTAAMKINESIARRVESASVSTSIDYVLISRSDSTLRGHYPLETDTLRSVIEESSDRRFDGEIICPFFIEGGRYTYGDIHYVLYGDELVPAGETEFAKDRSFGYLNSNLTEWIQEKTSGTFTKESVLSISLEMLRSGGPSAVLEGLLRVENFGKVVVNAMSYDDIRLFLAGFIMAENAGKRFIFRSAAAIPKLLGGISDIPLLTREQLCSEEAVGGLIIIGSHVEKTSLQLEVLLQRCDVVPIEFNQHLVFDTEDFSKERQRVQQEINRHIHVGRDVVVYTRRERIDMNTGNVEDELTLTGKISEAVTGFVKNIDVKPSYIIAKGGITSSEIGTIGLNVRRAVVAGQVLPGIPVWRLGEESRFPGMAYIIFPGNVGDVDALANIVTLLKGE